MIRRAYIIGILAAGLTATAVHGSPVYARLQSSAQNFQHYFHALKSSGASLSPVERFVFSLVLAKAKPAPEIQSVASQRRS
ncbi:MAG TPA: hypothetical protein VLY04_02445 [Bryobacteraceae bacterium]|nr:hypothetical protein [Bryobacteraceae bacterium]